MNSAPPSSQPDPNAIYRELLRAVPRLADMYRLVGDHVEAMAANGSRILIVGAGGGREIAALAKSKHALEIVAVDPSSRNLEMARAVAQTEGLSDSVLFIAGTVDDVLPEKPFDIALSLLVMHQIAGEAAKAAYLSSIQNRLGENGLLIHADLCVDAPGDLDALVQDYTSHAASIGIDPQVTQIELNAITQPPPLSTDRLHELFAVAGLSTPQEVFQRLWYRCWTANKPTSTNAAVI